MRALPKPDRSQARTLRPKPLRDWTLRTRLIASFLGLLIVVCAGIGVFTELKLKQSLTRQLDAQLTAQPVAPRDPGGGRTGPAGRGGVLGTGAAERVLPFGSPLGGIGAIVAGGVVSQSAYQSSTGPTVLSTEVQQALLTLQPDGRPRSLTLPGLGGYRVVAQQLPSGDVQVSGISLSKNNSILNNLALAIIGLSVLALAIAAILGAFIVRLALRPLRRVTATASRVAGMSLDQGEVAVTDRVLDANPHTEVGQVGVALNRMLENVTDALNARHRSEMRVRQFVADASHELRTPLASIRGYAELTRRSRDEAPPDIAHAMSRVESEAGRMTTLVEDLLLLARLDAGRPLDSVEVDLTRLAVDAVSDAHAAGRGRRWNLELPDEPVLVMGDGPRLHQVLANLLANARTHTPPGTEVSVSLSQFGTDVLLSVRDNGPGVPAGLMPDIFERFSRGEQSRSRAAGSTGLGLAIVAAVVAAHGGRITVTSLPGATVFAVTLPSLGKRQAASQSPASLTGQP